MGQRHDSILGTVGGTPVVKINRLAPDGINLYVKIEAFNPAGSVKDRLALGVIEAAEASGELKPGATILELDFLAEDADTVVRDALGGQADVVLSDMAAPASGHRATDHLRIIALAEAAAYFAFDVLAEGGTFATWRG